MSITAVSVDVTGQQLPSEQREWSEQQLILPQQNNVDAICGQSNLKAISMPLHAP